MNIIGWTVINWKKTELIRLCWMWNRIWSLPVLYVISSSNFQNFNEVIIWRLQNLVDKINRLDYEFEYHEIDEVCPDAKIHIKIAMARFYFSQKNSRNSTCELLQPKKLSCISSEARTFNAMNHGPWFCSINSFESFSLILNNLNRGAVNGSRLANDLY